MSSHMESSRAPAAAQRRESRAHLPRPAVRRSRHELSQIASIADEIDFRSGKILIREGDRGLEFFVLLAGEAEVCRRGRMLAIRGTGDFFGEIALLSNLPGVATVATTLPVRALVITDRDFRSLVRRSPAIALKVLEAVVQRLPADV